MKPIEMKDLQNLKSNYDKKPVQQALKRVLMKNDLANLFDKQEQRPLTQFRFSNEIKTMSVTYQKQSGRCWIFAGLNVLREIIAKKYDIKSTVLLLEVTKDQADLFKRYWTQLKLNPGAFNILGGNCSTHASEAFIDAKILTKGIPGLDTPNNLYKQLSEKYIGKCQTFSGYIGVRNKGRDLYDLVVE
jgi:hypothetical protein